MGLFILPFVDFLITANNIRLQVILSWNSQVKEPWKTLQFESQMFYILKKMSSQDTSGMKCFIYIDWSWIIEEHPDLFKLHAVLKDD